MRLSRLDKIASMLDGYEDPNVAVVTTMTQDSVHCPLCGVGRGIPGETRGRLVSYKCDKCDYAFSEAVRQAGIKDVNFRKNIKARLSKNKKTA